MIFLSTESFTVDNVKTRTTRLCSSASSPWSTFMFLNAPLQLMFCFSLTWCPIVVKRNTFYLSFWIDFSFVKFSCERYILNNFSSVHDWLQDCFAKENRPHCVLHLQWVPSELHEVISHLKVFSSEDIPQLMYYHLPLKVRRYEGNSSPVFGITFAKPTGVMCSYTCTLT